MKDKPAQKNNPVVISTPNHRSRNSLNSTTKKLVSTGSPPLKLEDGSRVAVIGGGPAGSFFSYFLLDMAERVDMELLVDIYEPRDFSLPAPHGCNYCAGVISESL